MLWIDATNVKVRRKCGAVTVAVRVNTDGRREVLGMDIGVSEAEPFGTADGSGAGSFAPMNGGAGLVQLCRGFPPAESTGLQVKVINICLDSGELVP